MTLEPRDRTLFWALSAVAVSLPVVWLLEVAIHWWLAESLEGVRELMGSGATAIGWGCLPFNLLGAAAAALWLRYSRPPAAGAGIWRELERLMVAASVAQVPSLVAIAAYLLG